MYFFIVIVFRMDVSVIIISPDGQNKSRYTYRVTAFILIKDTLSHLPSYFDQYVARWSLTLPIGHLVITKNTMKENAHIIPIPITLIVLNSLRITMDSFDILHQTIK